jgi:hypothetical protein
MKTITGFALGLVATLAVPAAFADDEMKTKSTTTTTTTESSTDTTATTPPTTDTTGTTESYNSTTTTAPAGSYGYTAPAATTTTTTTTATDDFYVHDGERADKRARVRSGVGLNVFGAAGSKDTARLGVGGRIEFVMPFGLALGGSYTQHFTSEADRTAVRPLLGEIGWSFAVVRHVEVRPMVGLGYAFASASSDTNNTGTSNQTAVANATVGGFDVAPGAKVSYVARSFEVFTLPKYHFISGNNFLGVEVGAGARF